MTEKHVTRLSKDPVGVAPVFDITESEAHALTLMEILSGRRPSQKLDSEMLHQLESLAQAYRQGQKTKAHILSQDFYAQVVTRERLISAYFKLQDLQVSGNADYQIVMDGLKELCGQQRPQILIPLSLEDALTFLLLAVTHSSKNSVFYKRWDPVLQNWRPTTFPLTEKLLQNFLSPFEGQEILLKRFLIVSRGMVMGHPAAYLYLQYKRRRRAFEQDLQAFEARQAALAAKSAQPKPQSPSRETPSEIRFVCKELEDMMTSIKEPQEKQAAVAALKPDALLRLMPQTESRDFGKMLNQIYRQHLGPSQASLLSAKLSSRLKRMLAQMDSWKEEYWSEFQIMMQKEGIWEGQEWLDKWRAHRQGKQALLKKPTEAPREDALGKMLKQAETLQDKQRGRQMLKAPEPHAWQQPRKSQASPEQRKVLSSLSHTERLDELLSMAHLHFPWEDEPEDLMMLLYEAFCMLGDTDLNTIKTQFLDFARAEQREIARQIMAGLELVFNQVVMLYKQDRSMNFAQAMQILDTRHHEQLLREKMNSQAYQNSPAAHYGRYGYGA